VFTINWIGCSRSNGISVHDPPERAAVLEPDGGLIAMIFVVTDNQVAAVAVYVTTVNSG
jgi:hypothetical protein